MLRRIPMPPTINKCYSHVGRSRFSSAELKRFKAEFSAWCFRNKEKIMECREGFGETNAKTRYRLEFEFKFPAAKLFTKDDRYKKLDLSNRIKVAEDAVCEVLGFDDKAVFEVLATKGPTYDIEHFNLKCSIIEENGHSII